MSTAIATNIGNLTTGETIPIAILTKTASRSGAVSGYVSDVTLTLEAGNFGYTSVTDVATGSIGHNLSVTFAAATYVACATPGAADGSLTFETETSIAYNQRTTTSFQTNVSAASDNADDDREVYAITIGELA